LVAGSRDAPTPIENTVASLTSILQPVLIAGLGIVIGAMLISLYLQPRALGEGAAVASFVTGFLPRALAG
jgi:hypothetical protein